MSANLEVLFSSTARVQILGLFLLNPAERFYQREIERQTGQPIRAVQREVERLEEAGLLVRIPEGRRVFYRLNPDYALLPQLTGLFRAASGSRESGMPGEVRQSPAPQLPGANQQLEQPFPWLDTTPAPPLPDSLRQRQAEREWDGAY
jgi:DNA-binding transcriptional ArsR family regulator